MKNLKVFIYERKSKKRLKPYIIKISDKTFELLNLWYTYHSIDLETELGIGVVIKIEDKIDSIIKIITEKLILKHMGFEPLEYVVEEYDTDFDTFEITITLNS